MKRQKSKQSAEDGDNNESSNEEDSYSSDEDDKKSRKKSSKEKRRKKHRKREKKAKKIKRKKRKRRHYSGSDGSNDSSEEGSLSSRDEHRSRRKKRKRTKSHGDEDATSHKSVKYSQKEATLPASAIRNHDTGTDVNGGDEMKKNEKRKRMIPMRKEEYEAQQKVVKEVFDPESGRYRLIRGSGEILERIVSRQDHQRINRIATRSDGLSYSTNLKTAIPKK